MPSLLHASQGSLSLSPPHARAPHATVQAQAVLPALGRATPTALPTHLEKVVTGWRGERGETRGRARREFFFRRIGAPLAALPSHARPSLLLLPPTRTTRAGPWLVCAGGGGGRWAATGREVRACVCVQTNRGGAPGCAKGKWGREVRLSAPPRPPGARAPLADGPHSLYLRLPSPLPSRRARARGPPLAGTPCPCPPPQLGARTAKKRAANTAMRAPPSPFTAGNAGDPVTGQQSLPTDPRPAFAAALAGSGVDVMEPMALGWCVWLWSLVVAGGARRGAWLPKKKRPTRAPPGERERESERAKKAPSPPRPHPAPRQQGPPHDRDARQALSQCL